MLFIEFEGVHVNSVFDHAAEDVEAVLHVLHELLPFVRELDGDASAPIDYIPHVLLVLVQVQEVRDDSFGSSLGDLNHVQADEGVHLPDPDLVSETNCWTILKQTKLHSTLYLALNDVEAKDVFLPLDVVAHVFERALGHLQRRNVLNPKLASVDFDALLVLLLLPLLLEHPIHLPSDELELVIQALLLLEVLDVLGGLPSQLMLGLPLDLSFLVVILSEVRCDLDIAVDKQAQVRLLPHN